MISFPAFAVEDKDIVKITKSEIIGRLEVLRPRFYSYCGSTIVPSRLYLSITIAAYRKMAVASFSS